MFYFFLLSLDFSKKSEGTLYSALHGAWCVKSDASSEFVVGTL